jgi:hypothetical protein
MNSKLWIRKALSACLSISILATCSAVALANSAKVAGELTVAGNGVLVNGESAQSGRSIFSSSTVTTPESAGAIVAFGKLGSIQIAPNSNVTLSFDDKGISGNLASGKVTVLGAANAVNMTTTNGTTVSLNAGESVLASGLAQDKDDDDNHGGAAWWALGAVMVAAGALIIYAATSDNDRIALGGNGTVVSPTR